MGITRSLKDTIADAQATIADAQRKLTALEKVGPEPPDGSVIRFHRAFRTSYSYSYAAVRIGPRWYVTGNYAAGRSFDWPDLVSEHLLTAGGYEVATGWRTEPLDVAAATAKPGSIPDRYAAVKHNGAWHVVDVSDAADPDGRVLVEVGGGAYVSVINFVGGNAEERARQSAATRNGQERKRVAEQAALIFAEQPKRGTTLR